MTKHASLFSNTQVFTVHPTKQIYLMIEKKHIRYCILLDKNAVLACANSQNVEKKFYLD